MNLGMVCLLVVRITFRHVRRRFRYNLVSAVKCNVYDPKNSYYDVHHLM